MCGSAGISPDSISNFDKSLTWSKGALKIIVSTRQILFQVWFGPEIESVAGYHRLPRFVSAHLYPVSPVIRRFQFLNKLLDAVRIFCSRHLRISFILSNMQSGRQAGINIFNIHLIQIITKQYREAFAQNICQFWEKVLLVHIKKSVRIGFWEMGIHDPQKILDQISRYSRVCPSVILQNAILGENWIQMMDPKLDVGQLVQSNCLGFLDDFIKKAGIWWRPRWRADYWLTGHLAKTLVLGPGVLEKLILVILARSRLLCKIRSFNIMIPKFCIKGILKINSPCNKIL